MHKPTDYPTLTSLLCSSHGQEGSRPYRNKLLSPGFRWKNLPEHGKTHKDNRRREDQHGMLIDHGMCSSRLLCVGGTLEINSRLLHVGFTIKLWSASSMFGSTSSADIQYPNSPMFPSLRATEDLIMLHCRGQKLHLSMGRNPSRHSDSWLTKKIFRLDIFTFLQHLISPYQCEQISRKRVITIHVIRIPPPRGQSMPTTEHTNYQVLI